MIFSLVNLARHLKIDAAGALEKTNMKFIARFRKMEEIIKNEGKELKEQPLEILDVYWEKAKRELTE